MPRQTRRSAAAAAGNEVDAIESPVPTRRSTSGSNRHQVPDQPENDAARVQERYDDENTSIEEPTDENNVDDTLNTETTPSKLQVVGLEPVQNEDQEQEPQTPPRKKPLGDVTQNNINQVVTGLQKVTLDSNKKPNLTAQQEPYPDTPVMTNRSASGRTSLVSSPSKHQQLPEMPPPPKQRLVISKLVLNNFKSYAGRQEIGPFHSSFSAVVGPNGSGKSNVIDSLLFVFGFRASKMRHGKISSLIHSSSAVPNLTWCSVEVHFQDVEDNDDGTTTKVAGTELVVARKAFKNNSSKYTIDEKESTFTEVTTLLKERGIDLDHKRFLILQGEVESIAQMKAKAENENDDGLLEYLEDIIGTSDYKTAIEETQTQVEQLNEDCLEKTNRLNIVEKELNSLEDKKEQVVKFLSVENEITLKKSALFQLYRHLCMNRIELGTKVIEEQQAKLKAELDQTAENKDQVNELAAEHKSKSKELDKLKKQAQEASKRLSKVEVEKVQIEEKKKHLDSKRKKLEKSIQQASHVRTESQSWLDNYQVESESLNEQLEQMTKELKKENEVLEQIQDELKDKTQGFTDEIEKTQAKLEPWRTKISQKESEVAVGQSQVDMLKERANAAGEDVSKAESKIESIRVKGREKKKEIEGLEKNLEHTAEQIKLGESEMEQASQGYSHMKQKLSSMRQKLATAKESQQSVQSQNKVLAGLTKLSQSGRIEGFHSRLGGLGTIDQKYDVAISTACPSLDNIVVDTVETGQQCVEYLRKNNLGRARFILLDQLPKRDLSKIQTPENVPRLFDLVKPKDDKFLPAFYSVLNDTLVAKDSDQARRIAYGKKRWRVVTLDGVLVDISGTMSGGGTAVKSGAMKDKLTQDVSEDTVQEMEEYLAKYETKVAEATKQYEQMESALKEFKDEKPTIELNISKAQMELKALESDLKEAQRQYEELAKEQNSTAGSITKDLEAANTEVGQRQGELDELKTHTQDMEQKIADLQEKIMDAGGVRLRMQKSKVDGIKEQMQLNHSRLDKGVMERTKAENEVKKQTKVIEKAENDIAESDQDVEQLTGSLKEMTGKINKADKEASELNDQVADRQEALDELKSDLEERQRQIDSVRSVEIEIQNTIEQHQKSLKEDQHALKQYEHNLGQLKLHDLAELNRVRRKVEPEPASENDDAKDEDQEMAEEKQQQQQQQHDGEDDEDQEDEKEDKEQEEPGGEDDDDKNEDTPQTLVEFSADELDEMNKDQLKQAVATLEEENSETQVDMQVLKDYRRRVEEYESRRATLNEAVTSRDNTKKRCDELRQKRLDEFMTGFNIISLKLKEMYQMITMGGNAELELVDSLDPFSEGIIFSVMPPKKSWRNIGNLSGGEKTLSSLALVFALHHYKPTPLYVMDEIDAALDFRNVSIVATYINERTKNGQFIVISLRNNMFELARQLVGIYKVNNMTRSIALENKPLA